MSSSDAEATNWLSGEKATAATELSWPSNVWRCASRSDLHPEYEDSVGVGPKTFAALCSQLERTISTPHRSEEVSSQS